MIVVFGSINIDLTFRVEHQPAPGETVLCPGYLASPGGKGANQAVAAARAGAATAMIGCVGNDSFAAPAMMLLKESGVDTTSLIAGELPTACAAICVDSSGENSITVASGANQEVRAEQVPSQFLGPDSLLLMQMEVPAEENWKLLERARKCGARTALNVAPAASVPGNILDNLDYLIVNEIEAAAIAGLSGRGPNHPEELARHLSSQHQVTCVLTLGAVGTILFGPDGGYSIPTLDIDATDTTGAGDTFVGVMAAGLASNLEPVIAARRASAAAAVACTKQGAQLGIPFSAEIDGALARLPAARRLS